MNIKKGDVLNWKNVPEDSVKVLSVIDGLYFVSEEADIEKGSLERGGYFYTLEGLKETFELPEEKWVPEMGEVYYIIMISGGSADIISSTWQNSSIDNKRQINNLVFQTNEEAEAKLAEVLAVLKN